MKDENIRIYREICISTHLFGPGSSVGIATGGLDSPGIESRWGRDFPYLSRPALGSTQPPVNGYRVFPRGKERPGRDADPSPLLEPWSRKSRAILLLQIRMSKSHNKNGSRKDFKKGFKRKKKISRSRRPVVVRPV